MFLVSNEIMLWLESYLSRPAEAPAAEGTRLTPAVKPCYKKQGGSCVKYDRRYGSTARVAPAP